MNLYFDVANPINEALTSFYSDIATIDQTPDAENDSRQDGTLSHFATDSSSGNFLQTLIRQIRCFGKFNNSGNRNGSPLSCFFKCLL